MMLHSLSILSLSLMVWICSANDDIDIAVPCPESDERVESVHGVMYSYCCVNCVKLYQSDMVLTNLGTGSCCDDDNDGDNREPRRLVPATSSEFTQWPNGSVPYDIDESMDNERIILIEDGIKELNEKTVINLYKRTFETNYIHFQPSTANNSPLGRNAAGRNDVNINSKSTGTVIHETGHSLGWSHTHMREDRDLYIKVRYQHIETNYMTQFGNANDVADDCLKYDYHSVMHYKGWMASKDGNDTMVSINPSGIKVGRGEHLTDLDIQCMKGFYSQCKVSLYEADHFQGEVYTPLGLGEYTLKDQYSADEYVPFSDNQIESLKVTAAPDTLCIIDLAEDKDFNGWYATINVDNTKNEYRETFDYNLAAIKAIAPQFEPNQMSSMRVSYKSSCSVTFFTENNYGGTAMGPYDAGKYTYNQLEKFGFSHIISSYKMNALYSELCTLQLFKNTDFTEEAHTKTVDGGTKGISLSVNDVNIAPNGEGALTAARCNAYLQLTETDLKIGNKVGTFSPRTYLNIEFDIIINGDCVAVSGSGNKANACNILHIGNEYKQRYPQLLIWPSGTTQIVLNHNQDTAGWGQYITIPSFPKNKWFHFYLSINDKNVAVEVDGVKKEYPGDYRRSLYLGKAADIYIASADYLPLLPAKIKNICIHSSEEAPLDGILSFKLTPHQPFIPISPELPLTASVCNAYLKTDETDIVKGNKVSTTTVTQYLEIEFDIKITAECRSIADGSNWWYNNYCNILHIGNSNGERFPQLMVNGNEWLTKMTTNTANWGKYCHFSDVRPMPGYGDEWFHVYMAANDNEVKIKIDKFEKVFKDDYTKTNFIGKSQDIYIGSPHYRAESAKIKNVCIRTLPPITKSPTKVPTKATTKTPTKAPTKVPTKVPTKAPIKPTAKPTAKPTVPRAGSIVLIQTAKSRDEASNDCKATYGTTLATIATDEQKTEALKVLRDANAVNIKVWLGLSNTLDSTRVTWDDATSCANDDEYQCSDLWVNSYSPEPFVTPDRRCNTFKSTNDKYDTIYLEQNNGCTAQYWYMCNKPKPITPTPTRPPVVPYTSNKFELIQTPKSYTEASNECKTKYGTTLATIATAEQKSEALKVLKGSGLPLNARVWLGLSNTLDSTRVTWDDGTPCANYDQYKVMCSDLWTATPEPFVAPNRRCNTFRSTNDQYDTIYLEQNDGCTDKYLYMCNKPKPITPTPTRPPVVSVVPYTSTIFDLIQTPKPYTEASNECKTKYGSTLATIATAEQKSEALKVLKGSGLPLNARLWLGLSNTLDSNRVLWDDATTCANYDQDKVMCSDLWTETPEPFVAPNRRCNTFRSKNDQYDTIYLEQNDGCTALYLYMCNKPVIKTSDKFVLIEGALNRADASNRCKNKYGTTLATISSVQQKAEALNLLSNAGSHEIWIGLSNTANTAVAAVKWDDGTACANSNDECTDIQFGSSFEPFFGPQLRCVAYLPQGGIGYMHARGSSSRLWYMCNKAGAAPAHVSPHEYNVPSDVYVSPPSSSGSVWMRNLFIITFVLMAYSIGCFYCIGKGRAKEENLYEPQSDLANLI